MLQENLKSSTKRLALECSWVFQKDSVPKHTSKVLNQATMEVLEWTS